jgi:hypothetical protein
VTWAAHVTFCHCVEVPDHPDLVLEVDASAQGDDPVEMKVVVKGTGREYPVDEELRTRLLEEAWSHMRGEHG